MSMMDVSLASSSHPPAPQSQAQDRAGHPNPLVRFVLVPLCAGRGYHSHRVILVNRPLLRWCPTVLFSPFVDNVSHCCSLESQSLGNGFVNIFRPININNSVLLLHLYSQHSFSSP
ncbi:hypothetical protein CHARACLAT_010322 [Characodon lateralis]|uniref:Uncharacterized protein n=1 Tax=Characodon lateralis TaxID=208331 RepID=A0ABU7EII2_9TELE|nr:hypothetical protein [Characodon lateralis]